MQQLHAFPQPAEIASEPIELTNANNRDAVNPGLWDNNDIPQNDALPLEYKLNKWRASRQVDVNYFINNTFVQGEAGILGAGLKK